MKKLITKLRVKYLTYSIKKLELLIDQIDYENNGYRFYSTSTIQYKIILKRLQLDYVLNKDINKENVWSLLTFLDCDQRTDIFSRFCFYCGDNNPRCQCNNDE